MAWFHGLRDWLDARLRGARRDRELEEEIRFHLELEATRQRERGHEPVTAWALARQRFGDVTRLTNETRAARGPSYFEGSMHDLRWAIRSLHTQPGFTALALLTLALGIGATTTAFTVLDTVLLRPLPYSDAGRLVYIRERSATQSLLPPSYPNFVDWREQATSFSGVASTMFFPPATVNAGGEPIRGSFQGVSRGFFRILGVRPVIGREFTDAENAVGGARAVMVSHAFWQQHMRGRTELGTIRWGETAVPVVGVLPPGFAFVDATDVWFPHEQWPGTVRSAHNYRVVARLRPGVTLESARAEMTTLSARLRAAHGDGTQAVDAEVLPLREFLVGDYRVMLSVVFGAAGLVLLIACTNLVSAQLARGLARQREVAVRAALGASRGRIVRLLFLETALLVASGSALGAGLAMVFTRVVRALGTGQVPRLEELTVDAGVMAFVAAVAITAAILAGLYPALRLAGGDPGDALRAGRGSGTVVRRSVWRVLVGFEVATAVVLLVGSTLLIRTLHNILHADTGFDSRGVVTASLTPNSLGPDWLERIEQIRTELAVLPGVTGVAYTSRLPLSWGAYSAPVIRPADPIDRDWPAMAGFRVVTPGYFEVLQQRVLRGRTFTDADRAGSPRVAVITSGIAERLWPGEDPIGKQVASNYMVGEWMTVVGVVTEASSWTMPRGTQNEIYTVVSQQPSEGAVQLVAVIRASGDAEALVPAVRARLRDLAPGLPAQLSTLEARIRRSAADRRFAMFALTAFGAIALVLAAVGIYGVVSYTVVMRTREIGIRIAVGAAPALVRGDVLRQAASMALAGIVAGSLGGMYATRFLSASLYGVTAFDPIAYLAGGGILLVAAMLGAYVPAVRASRVDPLLAIRSD